MTDVARLAGVSAQTVSRVTTGAQRVSPHTRERVIAAMNQLGYVPNQAAKALRSGEFGVIGVLTQRIERTGESLTTSGVVDAAVDAGYTIALVQTHQPESGDGRNLVRRLTQQAIDGLIIVQAGTSTDEQLCLPPDLPVAVSDSALSHRYPSVNADQRAGMQHAMDYLMTLGHQHIAHVTGPGGSQSALLRQDAWSQALHNAGLPAEHLYDGDWTARSGYAAGQAIAATPEITAVMCANDEIAFGVMRALYEHGIRIPQDVSVIGFDGIDLGEYAPVPLTTVRQDFAATGATMVDLVVQQVKNGIFTDEFEQLIPTELVIRESTGPATRR